MSWRTYFNLSLVKRAILVASGTAALALPLGILGAHPAQAQSPSASKMSFEVASIKPCKDVGEPGGRGGGGNVSARRLYISCQTVEGLIQSAYVFFENDQGNRPKSIPPISGGPGWVRSDRYAIEATTERDASTNAMRGVMLQALLEDRFKLKLHRESREVPVYALTVAKGGFKLKPNKTCRAMDRTQPAPPPGPEHCGGGGFGINGRNVTMDMFGTSVEQLAGSLGNLMDRPVVDRTGASGLFDFRLEYEPDETTPGAIGTPSADGSIGTSLFTAIQEQLGLKLESAKGTREFLVIDRVERPTEN